MTDRRTLPIRVVAGAGWLAAALMLAGCVGIPESGPVVRVAASGSRTHTTVRYEPAKPRPGASPQQVVDGYLDAMLAYPEATGIVKTYLTPEAAATWDSRTSIVVYSTAESTYLGRIGNEASVEVKSRELVTVDATGRATVDPIEVSRILQVVRVDGQWRVANPIAGYLISRGFADDYLRSYPLWFFDESGRHLVPELVHEVVSEQVPIALTNRLAEGPRVSAFRTHLPAVGDLDISIAGKIAKVDIRSSAKGTRDRIAAQLLSTLRGIAGLDGVQILIDGIPDGDVHLFDAVVGYGAGASASEIYALRDNRVVQFAGKAHPIAGPWGRSAQAAVGIAVDTDAIAAVLNGRDAVLVAPRRSHAGTTFAGTDFVDPVWDDEGRLWLVDSPSVARVQVIEGDQATTIDSAGLGRVESFALSPDGSRYAAVTASDAGAIVSVGIVEHDAVGRPLSLLPPHLVSFGLTGERAVGWASSTRVEFLAASASGKQLHSVEFDGMDGFGAQAREALPGGVTDWAGPPHDGADRWVRDTQGRVWFREPDGPWQQRTTSALRGLSSGR